MAVGAHEPADVGPKEAVVLWAARGEVPYRKRGREEVGTTSGAARVKEAIRVSACFRQRPAAPVGVVLRVGVAVVVSVVRCPPERPLRDRDRWRLSPGTLHHDVNGRER